MIKELDDILAALTGTKPDSDESPKDTLEISSEDKHELLKRAVRNSDSAEPGSKVCDLTLKVVRSADGINISASSSCEFTGTGADKLGVIVAVLNALDFPKGIFGKILMKDVLEMYDAHADKGESE